MNAREKKDFIQKLSERGVREVGGMKKDLCWGVVMVLAAVAYGFILGSLVPRAIDVEMTARAASSHEARTLSAEAGR